MKKMKKMKKIMAIVLSSLLLFSSVLPVSTTEAASNTITDIPTNNAKYKSAKWAIDNELLELYTGGKFQTFTLVTEWQMLTMIAKLDKNYNFSYDKDMLYAYYADLNIPLYGITSAAKRNANISRGHFARLYAAMNGLDLSEVQAVQYLYANEITTGTTGKRTYEDYAPNKNITRGDMATFMYRSAQKGGIALEGLTSEATGKDNNKITLPSNFIDSTSGSVELQPTPGKNTNDKENRPSIYKAVQNISVSTEELNANGVDSSLITINLKDSYGNDIPYDKSLEFKVTSEAGAIFSDTGVAGDSVKTVFTDGPELNVFVTAPALTKSIKDTIRFEMVNTDDKNYYTYKNQVIEVPIRYVPEAELRISYEVFDPNAPDWAGGGNVTPGIKPLPALPANLTPGNITITDFDEDTKTFDGFKYETYTSPETGQLVTGDREENDIQYENAELKLEGQVISTWLFEQMLYYMIDGELENETSAIDGSGGVGSVNVNYSINSEGRPVYNLLGIIPDSLTSQFESNIHAAVVFLINMLPKSDDITLTHEESIMAIKAIYDKLGQNDKNMLQQENGSSIGNLEGALSKVNVLLAGQELANRPEGMERYTKVIVNIVAPGGRVITDYMGQVEVTFNGVTRVVSFDTNTRDYTKGTGYLGSAVVFYDDILYGDSKVTAKLVDSIDPRYKDILKEILYKPITDTIFTNPKFEQNVCTNAAEIAFLVDHSGSTRKTDPTNYVALKTKEMIRQMGAEKTAVYRFNPKATLEAQGTAEAVASTTSLLDYKRPAGGTNVMTSLETVLNNLSDDKFTAKAIVLVTDGKTSKNKMNQVLQKAKDKGVKIYTVAIGNYKDTDEALLRQISTDTGGQFFNITDVHNLHGVYQSIINSILCGKAVADNSCLTGDALFNESTVTTTRQNVVLTGRIATHCDNVYAVSVIFASTGGNVTYDLQHRGGQLYRLTKYVSEFLPFSLYNEVEFQAFDKAGTLIASKTIEI